MVDQFELLGCHALHVITEMLAIMQVEVDSLSPRMFDRVQKLLHGWVLTVPLMTLAVVIEANIFEERVIREHAIVLDFIHVQFVRRNPANTNLSRHILTKKQLCKSFRIGIIERREIHCVDAFAGTVGISENDDVMKFQPRSKLQGQFIESECNSRRVTATYAKDGGCDNLNFQWMSRSAD